MNLRLAPLTLPLLVLGCGASEEEPVPAPAPQVPSKTLDSEVKTVEYKDELKLDFYRPKEGKAPFPAVILLHGGGWSGGSRSEMAGIARIFAEEGLMGVTASYRLAPKNLWPAQREDVAAAVAYLREHAEELDIKRDAIGASGVSAGGHLSTILGTDGPGIDAMSRVQAVGSISGIHDLAAPMTSDGDRYRIVETLLGETTKRDPAKRKEASPATYASGTTAPTMFVVGGEDPLVPRSQSELMEKRLKAAGVEAEILDVPEMGHVPNPNHPADEAAMRRLAKWMKAKLGG
ncbi:MAG: alpha/beta hydrolase [Fimbriimonas sp.]